MKTSSILVLALMACVSVGANAYQKPRVKPTYTSDKPNKSSGGRASVTPSQRSSSSAQELKRVEQSSARNNGAAKSGKANAGPVLKADKSGTNPPIRLSGNGKSNGPRGKTADPSKGRLRQKNH
jgi:hypothetical protein